MDNAIELIISIAEKYQLPIVKEKNNKIQELQYKFENDKEIIIEKEHTKQKEIELKQKELDVKQKEIEKDKEIVIKKLDIEFQIQMKKLEFRKSDVEIEIKPKKKKLSDRETMLQYFEFTGNQKDMVSVANVNNMFVEKFDQKIKILRKLIVDFGAKKKKIKQNGQALSYYICCKLR